MDPFVIIPIELERVPGIPYYPNHPHLNTIYFPFTQFFSIIPILIANYFYTRYNIALFDLLYRMSFISFSYILIYFILKHDKKYIYFFSLPIFLIELSSLHTDIHGILFLILFFKLRNPYLKSILIPHIIFIKPEGFIIYINLFLSILYFYYTRKNKIWIHFILLNFIVFLIYIMILYWAWKNQYISFLTIIGLLKEAKIFNEYFLAYQPWILLIQFLLKENSYISIMFYRKYIIWLVTLVITINFFIFLIRKYKIKNLIEKFRKKRVIPKKIFFILILYQLIVFFHYKSSWQPWYFLWFMPILWELKFFNILNYLSSILVLFYIPVIFLRLDGEYQYHIFFISLALVTLFIKILKLFKKQVNLFIDIV